MSFFSWAAPIFKQADRRWSDRDFREVADLMRPCVSGSRPVLDLAGGTGGLSAGVAAALGVQVVIADATPQMLTRVAAHPLVSVRLTRAESLPFPADHFDALICSDSFHHFRDQDTAAREMARVVRPDGCVLVLEVTPVGLGRVAVYGERLLGEPGCFHDPEQLADLHGGEGHRGYGGQARRSDLFLPGHSRQEPAHGCTPGRRRGVVVRVKQGRAKGLRHAGSYCR